MSDFRAGCLWLLGTQRLSKPQQCFHSDRNSRRVSKYERALSSNVALQLKSRHSHAAGLAFASLPPPTLLNPQPVWHAACIWSFRQPLLMEHV